MQGFVWLHWQKNCWGTIKANNVFLASALAIILLMAFELKFERCPLNVEAATREVLSVQKAVLKNFTIFTGKQPV